MSVGYKAKYVIGYYLTMEEWSKYLNTNVDEFAEVEAVLAEFAHYVDVSEKPTGDMVFGVCRSVAGERKFAEIKDGDSYISMAMIREIIDKLELCFPNLPHNANRVVKEYICCQVV